MDIAINSNINLHYVPMNNLKTTTVTVYIHRPLTAETSSKNALLPYVMKSGCKKYSDSEIISKKLEKLYGATIKAGVMKIGDDNIMYVMGETISDRYALTDEPLTNELTELILGLVFEATAFDRKNVSREKKNACVRLMSFMNNKRAYASERCTEEMCKGDAFATRTLGTMEGLSKIKHNGLKSYYEDLMKSSQMDIYVCGTADADSIAEIVKKYTNNVQFNEATIPKTEKFSKNRVEINKVEEVQDIKQGKLSMGFSTGITISDDKYPALMVANSIFGGGAHSKLFNNVREKLSLCYYASSQLLKHKGIMLVNAGIEFENYQKAYDEILLQVEDVKNGNITEKEFSAAVNYLISTIDASRDSQLVTQIFHLEYQVLGECGDSELLKEKIRNVTMQDVKNAFKDVKLDTVYFLKGKEMAQ